MLRWRSQLYQIHLMMAGGMMGMVVIIFYFQVIMRIGFNQTMLLALVAIIIALIVATYFMMMKWSEVLHSMSTLVRAPTEETARRLEELLEGEGIAFTRRRAGPRHSGFKTTFREVLEVGELRIALLANRGVSVVFLGPVNRENAGDVERLKAVVERAAGMA